MEGGVPGQLVPSRVGSFRARATAILIVIAGFVLFSVGVLALTAATAALLGDATPHPTALATSATVPISLLLLALLRWGGRLAAQPAPPRPTPLPLAIVGGTLLLLVGTAIVSLAARALGLVPAEQPALLDAVRAVPAWQLYLAFGLLAPVGEELLFRRFMLTTLRRAFTPPSAQLATAVAFAALHGNLPAFPIYLFTGLVLGLAYERTGRLAAPIAIHAANNLLVTTLHVATTG